MIARILLICLATVACAVAREQLIRHVVDPVTDTHVEISAPFTLPSGGFVPLRVKIANNRPDPLAVSLSVSGTCRSFRALSVKGGCRFRLEAPGGGVASRDLLVPVPGEWMDTSLGAFSIVEGMLEVGGQSIPFSLPVGGSRSGGVPGRDSRGYLLSLAAAKLEDGSGNDFSAALDSSALRLRSTGPLLSISKFEPADLPEEWLAYSGFDCLIFTLADWTAASSGARRAVMSWVRAGGHLAFYHPQAVEVPLLGLTPEEWAERGKVERSQVSVRGGAPVLGNNLLRIPAGFGAVSVVSPWRRNPATVSPSAPAVETPAVEITAAGLPQTHPWLELTELGKEQVDAIVAEKLKQPDLLKVYSDPAALRSSLESLGYSREQAEALVPGIRGYFGGKFDSRRNPPAAVMVALNRYRSCLVLPAASTISVEAASVLSSWQGGRFLHLSGLSSLPPELAAALVRGGKRKNLFLTGLETLTPEAVRAFGNQWVPVLSLSGLRELSPAVAGALARMNIQSVKLNGLRSIRSDCLAVLEKGVVDRVDLTGLEMLPAEVLKAGSGNPHNGGKVLLSELLEKQAAALPGTFDFSDPGTELEVKNVPGRLDELAASRKIDAAALLGSLGSKAFGMVPFMIALGLFGLLVGPLNVWLFAKSGRRHRLFVTTPLIAIGFSLLLGLVMLAVDGTGGEGVRQAVVEIVEDGGTSTAHVVQQQYSRAGLLIGSRFEVDPVCQVLPARVSMNPWTRFHDQSMGGFRFDLQPEGGVLQASGDWFQSRSEQAQVLRAVMPMRGGISRAGGAYASGFGFGIDELYLCDGEGLWHRAKAVAPGAAFPAERITAAEALEALKGEEARHDSILEKDFLHRLASRKNSFVAITGSAPGIDTLSSIRWKSTRTILTGRIR